MYELVLSVPRLRTLLSEAGIDITVPPEIRGHYLRVLADGKEVHLELAERLGGDWHKATAAIETVDTGGYL